MRERKYSPQDVQKQVEKLLSDLRGHPEEWRKLPYRYICLFCGVPLRSAQPILIQLRANRHIEYRYIPTAAKIPTVICHYTEQENQINTDKFAQFTVEEFNYLLNKVSRYYNPIQEYHDAMLMIIFVEQLVLNGFREQWTDLPFGFYAVTMGTDSLWIETVVQKLEECHIVKRLGISRMYRVALSEEEYEQLQDSAYVKQQEEIINNSKKTIEEIPQETEADFAVLDELNVIAKVTKELIQTNYAINENVVHQQLVLRSANLALESLKEKETVYAGMAVRIDAVSKNYENAIKEAQDLRIKNSELKHLMDKEEKFYQSRETAISKNLETMMGSILSVMEEYFSLPTYEKNKVSHANRVKTQISRIVLDTIDAIQKGKDPV